MSQQTDYIMEYIKHNHAVPSEVSTDNIIMPKLRKLDHNLYALVFSIMKLLPAKNIIEKALQRNDIQNGYTVLATSSGTFALGVALICHDLDIPFNIYGDPAIDNHLLEVLEGLGGNIHLCTNPAFPGAYQEERLRLLKTHLSENNMSYWLRQYDNLDNKDAYKSVGNLLANKFKQPITLVGTVGSGGSTSGIANALNQLQPTSKLVGVDTFNSVLFGQKDGKRVLRGLGNSIMPKNLEHKAYDEIHWVSANDVYNHTHSLLDNFELFCGPTSGASYQVAKYLAKKNPHDKHVFIAPDGGFRYRNTVFNSEWLKQEEHLQSEHCFEPKLVNHPLDAHMPWSYIKWSKKTLNQVLQSEQ